MGYSCFGGGEMLGIISASGPGWPVPQLQLCQRSKTGSEQKLRALSHPKDLGTGTMGKHQRAEAEDNILGLGKLAWFQREGEVSPDLGRDGIRHRLWVLCQASVWVYLWPQGRKPRSPLCSKVTVVLPAQG